MKYMNATAILAIATIITAVGTVVSWMTAVNNQMPYASKSGHYYGGG
jgi:hypothetical protein